MRCIDLDEILLKRARWGNGQELWTDSTLKKDFREHFFDKCWYTEVPLAGQDIHIDHFRPKADLKKFKNCYFNQALEGNGYNWLANDPNNYRGCCICANRKTGEGGKGNYFPLRTGSPCLTNGGAEQELPLLIDPCNRDEVCLITFMGKDVLCASSAPDDIERVDVSKQIYNLDDPSIKSSRSRVWEWVSKILAGYSSGNISEPYCISLLSDAVDKKAIHSACAIACVNSLAPDEIKRQLNLEL